MHPQATRPDDCHDFLDANLRGIVDFQCAAGYIAEFKGDYALLDYFAKVVRIYRKWSRFFDSLNFGFFRPIGKHRALHLGMRLHLEAA